MNSTQKQSWFVRGSSKRKCLSVAPWLNWALQASLAALLVMAVGCNSKQGLGDKVKVQASPKLTELGVQVVDWRCGDNSFGVKLAASKPFGDPWEVMLQIGNQSYHAGKIELSAGQSKWVDYTTPRAFGQPIKITERTGTITIAVRNQAARSRGE